MQLFTTSGDIPWKLLSLLSSVLIVCSSQPTFMNIHIQDVESLRLNKKGKHICIHCTKVCHKRFSDINSWKCSDNGEVLWVRRANNNRKISFRWGGGVWAEKAGGRTGPIDFIHVFLFTAPVSALIAPNQIESPSLSVFGYFVTFFYLHDTSLWDMSEKRLCFSCVRNIIDVPTRSLNPLQNIPLYSYMGSFSEGFYLGAGRKNSG